MRVMIVSDCLDEIGGAEISSKKLVNALAEQQEIEKIIWIGVQYGNRLPAVNSSKVQLIPIKNAKTKLIKTLRKRFELAEDIVVPKLLAKKIKENENNADVIHAQQVRSAIALKLSNSALPNVITVRDYWPVCAFRGLVIADKDCSGCSAENKKECIKAKLPNAPFPIRALAAWYLKKKGSLYTAAFGASKNFIWNSKALQHKLNQGDGRVIHPCFGFEKSAPKIENLERPAIVFAGKLLPAKGVRYLLFGMQAVLRKNSAAMLYIFGDGSLRNNLTAMAEKLGIASNVKFMGAVPNDEMPQYFSAADIIVLPSVWQEPFSRVVIEAMALGKAIIATKTGGSVEAISNGSNGVLVKPKNSKEIADAINYLLENPKEAARLGKNASQFAARNFSGKAVAKKHLQFYKEIIESSASSQ